MTHSIKFGEAAAEEISEKLASSGLLLSTDHVRKVFPIALDEMLKMFKTDKIGIMKLEAGEHEFIFAYADSHFMPLFVDGIVTKEIAEYFYSVFWRNHLIQLHPCQAIVDSLLWYVRKFILEHASVYPNAEEPEINELIFDDQFVISSQVIGEYMTPNKYSYDVKISKIKSYKS